MKYRTKGQNEILIMKILDELAKGGAIKNIASQLEVPLNTLTNLMSRYRRKHGFKSTYQMLAVYVTVKEGKHGGVL